MRVTNKGHTKKRWDDGTDDGPVHASQPAIRLSRRRVYKRQTCNLLLLICVS